MYTTQKSVWQSGIAPIAVVMISLNEGHNMEAICQNLKGWAQEVFLVDSYSQDNTIDIVLRHGVHVVQRKFQSFGDQWNFALNAFPITAKWTMKIDPDERLTEELKSNILKAIQQGDCDGITFNRRWWFMGNPLPIRERLLRVWRTGSCRFTDNAVNEHPVVNGKIYFVNGDMDHYDSPDLDHWFEKQNKYSTLEAVSAYENAPLAAIPSLFGSALQRRMWIKKHFYMIPFRFFFLFLYFWLWKGTWRAGWVGYASARLWTSTFFWIECKYREIEITGRLPIKRIYGPGKPDERVKQID